MESPQSSTSNCLLPGAQGPGELCLATLPISSNDTSITLNASIRIGESKTRLLSNDGANAPRRALCPEKSTSG